MSVPAGTVPRFQFFVARYSGYLSR